ncbi:MAG: hypothetical protein ACI837_003260 [Crocinitomicaceae bacterium]|jgi:hypothetical protein
MSSIAITETGKIEIFYLKKIWFYYQNSGSSKYDKDELQVDWIYINAIFNILGLGTEPTLKFLLNETSSFEVFEDWVLENGKVSPDLCRQFNDLVTNKHSRAEPIEESTVLSEADLHHWETKGYVVIRGAVPREDCEKTAELIYKTLDATPEDETSWYKSHPLKQGIMVQMFHNELLDKNRLAFKIRKAFEELWKRNDLLVSMDRVSFNPPETEFYRFPGPNLHWDVSLKKTIPFGLQGLLYLSDTEKTQGAFTVIPGFHNVIDSWLDNLEIGTNPRETKLLDGYEREAIAGGVGDFIIWNQCLPHGSCPNSSTKPRIVQYINYQPIDLKLQEEWI